MPSGARVATLLATILLAGIAATPGVLYLVGLSAIPMVRLTAMVAPAPQPAIRALWASLGGYGAPGIERSNPYSLVLGLWRGDHGLDNWRSPERRVAELASFAIIPRGSIRVTMLRWHLATAAAALWAGRHWSAEQALSAYLHGAYFGHGFQGLEQGALGYFGRPATDLTAAEAARLVVIAYSPTRLDPWCHPAENAAAAAEVEVRFTEAVSHVGVDLLPRPEGACEG